MWSKKHKIWKQYQKNIVAKDSYNAAFLFAYMNYVSSQRLQYSSAEIMDLQQYKLIKRPQQVRRIARENRSEPFIFLYSLN